MIAIQPLANSHAFVRLEYRGGDWREHSRGWLPQIMPSILKESWGRDLVFSTFRQDPPRPDLFALPDSGIVTVYLPLGPYSPEWGSRQEWGTLIFYGPGQPTPGKRFRRGIGDQLVADVFNPSAYEALKVVSQRERFEIWVRHGWTAHAIAPGAFEEEK